MSGDWASSVQLGEEVYQAYRSTLGLNHPRTQAALNNLHTAYLKSGKMLKAIALLKDKR